MMLTRRGLTLGAIGSSLLAGGCSQTTAGAEALTAKIYVLVDLSKTWLTQASEPLNRSVLREIAGGLGLFAADATPPLEFQYRAIGDAGLGSPPLQVMRFEPSMSGTKKSDPDYLYRSLKKLRERLNYKCVDGILALPPENTTEIQPVLASISQRPEAAITKRYIIVASDLREEMLGEPARILTLSGFHVLLLYRPVEDDNINRKQVNKRVTYWRSVLRDKNAEVSAMIDADVKRSDIVRFLNGKFDERRSG